MTTAIMTTLTEAELDSKIFNAVNKAFQLNGLSFRKSDLKDKKIPIDINQASQITGLAKSTIYALAPVGAIPNFKKGKRLYFYEDELLAWINSGKRLSPAEVDQAADEALIKK
jgi:predicted DNA-binding transcriptional regulator AlpA